MAPGIHGRRHRPLHAVELSPTGFSGLSPQRTPTPQDEEPHGLDGAFEVVEPTAPKTYKSRKRILQGESHVAKRLPSPQKTIGAHEHQLRSSPRLRAKREADTEIPKHSKTSISAKRHTDPQNGSPNLSSFFVESKTKPTWSPTVTPKSKTASPFSSQHTPHNNGIHSAKVTKLTAKLQSLTDEPTSQVIDSGWDFLDDIEENSAAKPRTTLKTKVLLRSPRKEKRPEHHKELLQFFESESFQSKQEHIEQKVQLMSGDEDVVPQDSAQINRNHQTYGSHRSFLLEKNNVMEPDMTHDSGSDLGESIIVEEEDQIRSITNIRAQGENAQFLDEFNYIIEGIESKYSLSSLLELAMKLFDDDFLKFVNSRGLPKLHSVVDKGDDAACYVLGFILCKVSDRSHQSLDLNRTLVGLLRTLMGAPSIPVVTKGSKSVKTLFADFRKKLGDVYTPQFVAITLMFQRHIFAVQENLPGLTRVLEGLDLRLDANIKLYNMLLILFETYMSQKDTIPQEIEDVFSYVSEQVVADTQTLILQTKLFIVLAVKKFSNVYTSSVTTDTLKMALSTRNSELQLLSIGLLVSLVEDPSCLKAVVNPENIKRVHRIYEKAQPDSIAYISLLIGTLYVDSPLQVRKHFDRTELDMVILELQKLDKGNTLMSLQVRKILSELP